MTQVTSVHRRTFLKAVLTVTGSAVTAILAACGGESIVPTATSGASVVPTSTSNAPSRATNTPMPTAAVAPTAAAMVQATAAGSPTMLTTGGKSLPELRVGVQVLVYRSLDPHAAASNIGQRLTSMIFDTLIRRDFRNGDKLVPSLATEWKRTDDVTLEFTLRRNVMWQDGSPFTAADVKYTFDRLLAKDSKLEFASPSYFPFARVEMLDDYRVRIVSLQPDPIMERRFTISGSVIIPAKYHQQVGADAFGSKPIGTGPYRVTEYVPDDHLVFEAHDNGFTGLAAAKRVTMRVIPEVSGRTAAITNGEIDLVTNVPPDQATALAKNTSLTLKTVAPANILMFRLNQQVKPVDRPEIRQAIDLAIDRETIIASLWNGNAVRTRGFQYLNEEYYNPNRPLMPYDPEGAKRLLAKGGYAGEEIVYLIDSPSYYTNERENAEALIGMFKAVGMPLRIEQAESNQTVDMFKTNKFHMMATSSSSSFGDPDGYLYKSWGPGSALQQNGWWPVDRAAKFNALVTEARTTLDHTKRFDLYQQALDEFDAQTPLGIFYTGKEIYAMKKTIDWTPYPLYDLDLRPYNFTVT